ncbi:MAG: ASCH domain-containing protein [Gammaproteobacteria bacterium]
MNIYLPSPARRPTIEALTKFCDDANRALPGVTLELGMLDVRWIGLDAPSTQRVFELVRQGDKRGTFSLPWIIDRIGGRIPQVGDWTALVDLEGRPTLLTRTIRVDSAVFGQVEPHHTAIDGSSVRDPAVWIPLHTNYWNTHLAPFGLRVTSDMRFWIEEFVLVYDAENCGINGAGG